jgi:hypothetical protein
MRIPLATNEHQGASVALRCASARRTAARVEEGSEAPGRTADWQDCRLGGNRGLSVARTRAKLRLRAEMSEATSSREKGKRPTDTLLLATSLLIRRDSSTVTNAALGVESALLPRSPSDQSSCDRRLSTRDQRPGDSEQIRWISSETRTKYASTAPLTVAMPNNSDYSFHNSAAY